MKIINIENLDTSKTIVMTGRPNNVRKIAKHLEAILYYCPDVEDYFEDYPSIVQDLKETVKHKNRVVIVTTQSKEFLDCLLESDMDFTMVTVRKYDHDDEDTYRLRVVTKEEALDCRCTFNMEFRV